MTLGLSVGRNDEYRAPSVADDFGRNVPEKRLLGVLVSLTSHGDEGRSTLLGTREQLRRRHATPHRAFDVDARRRLDLANESLERRIDTETSKKCLANRIWLAFATTMVHIHESQRYRISQCRAREYVERRACRTDACWTEVDADDGSTWQSL